MAAEVLERVEEVEDVDALVEAPDVPEFPDVHLDRRFVVNRDGKDFVLYAGLVDMLHQLSDGFFDVTTDLRQVPSKDNGDTAIVTARVLVFDPERPDVVRRTANGIGDANPGNVTRMMAPHLIRMAETRAVARALRLLTNVAMTTREELGPDGGEPEDAPPAPAERPASRATAAPDRIQIDGKWYDRDDIQRAFHQRVKEARRAGLVSAEVETMVVGQTPLPVLVGLMQTWKRQLAEREGGTP